MDAKKSRSTLILFLIAVLCTSLINVQVALADGEPPTEPPAPTEVETEPPVEPLPTEPPIAATELPTEPPVIETELPVEPPATEPPVVETPVPVESTPVPEEETIASVTEILSQVPEDTEVVVLDENGDPLALAAQEAAEIMEVVDPIWCPEGAPLDSPLCSANFTGATAITDLIADMSAHPENYEGAGVIYFTGSASQPFELTVDSLGASAFAALSDNNLTLQGGWNGVIGPGPYSFTHTSFGANPVTIGTATNPWVGNITINDIRFNNVSTANAITIYTTNGNIELDTVGVGQQTGGYNTALLDSDSGNITVEGGSVFDGAGGATGESQGFSATTRSGFIVITDTTFYDSKRNSHNGATLNASTVTLTNASAIANDGSGIVISNPNATVTLTGGTFTGNVRYGIEVISGTLVVLAPPNADCETRNGLGCYHVVAPAADTTPPVITYSLTGTLGSNGWYTSDVTLVWTVTDPQSAVTKTGCIDQNITVDQAATDYSCSATSSGGSAGPVTVSIKRDTTAPTLSLPADITTPATGPAGAIVTYTASATDNFGASVDCVPPSGSTFGVGTTPVNCIATDGAGNTDAGSFQVTVQNTIVVPVAPTNIPGTSGSSIVPVTGGPLIDLDCDSIFWAFGVKFSFINLCDQQAAIHKMGTVDLPAELPDGYSLVMGIGVDVLNNGQLLEVLPSGSSIHMDFPMADGAKDQFTVLYWNGSEWIEVPQEDGSEQLLEMFSTITEKTGVFVLAKK